MNPFRMLLLLAFTLLTVSAASAQINQFAGKWKNVDPQTKGVTTIQIEISGSRIRMQTWGKCHPTDCAWGFAEGTAYAPSVASNLVETADTISTIYLTSFSQITLIVRPAEEGQIRVEVLTKFTDQSGRANTRRVDSFSRVEDGATNVRPLGKGAMPQIVARESDQRSYHRELACIAVAGSPAGICE